LAMRAENIPKTSPLRRQECSNIRAAMAFTDNVIAALTVPETL
jgi:hypothetical protein